MSSFKVLITGGAGYLGSTLTYELINAGHKVIVYDNLMYKQTPFMDLCYNEDFTFVYGDVRDIKKLLSYVNKADIIIPLAAIVGFPACERDKQLALDVNYNHIKAILEHKRAETKIIYPNTNSGYGVGEKGVFCTEETPLNPISHYGKTKCMAEDHILSTGGVSFRLATVFGSSPRMRIDLLVNDFTLKAMRDKYIVLFEWEFNRNYIHVKDVARAFKFAIKNYDKMSGQTYNIGLSDTNITKLQLAERIKKFIPEFSIQKDNIATDPDKRDYIVSNKKIESLGWKPIYTLDSGIAELLKCYEIISRTLTSYTNI